MDDEIQITDDVDESVLPLISKIGTHLSQRTRPPKDFIVKSLKQAASAFSQIEQFSSETTDGLQPAKQQQAARKRKIAIKPLGDTIVHGLLQHSDKDVRLLVAICVTEIFRIMAPEPPFEDKYLRDIFRLIISTFADLADTESPFFSKRVKILDTVAQIRCCVIMLDIDCNDLVLEMFKIFFSVVRDDHNESLLNAMSSIMRLILYEETSQQILEVILRNLIKGRKDTACAASQLAASVIKTCAEELEPLVCGFLTACILDKDNLRCELKEFHHEIILKVFECAPYMLLAVIPSLINELLADQVDVRIKAVNLLGKLFSLPEHHVAQKYHDLFVEFLKRFSDKSVDVRISALQCAKSFYVANPSARESHEIISTVGDRLLDFDDRVRMQAVLVACDICRSNLKLVPHELLCQATERLRDKKISVRKRALQKLIEVYQDYCNKCCEGGIKMSDHFEEIPSKIMLLCCDKDCKEFRSQNMDFVLADDLFPEHLSIEQRTKHWIQMFSRFGSLQIKALDNILTQKRRLQIEMKNYLALRKKRKELSSEETQKKTERMFVKIAASFPEPSKAEECLHKLNKIKDNHVFKSLEQLLEDQNFTTRQTILDKLLDIIGDRDPYFEFLRSLFSKCSCNIFSSEHVHFILEYLSNSTNGNKHLEDSSLKLLLAIVRVFPSTLKGSEKQFKMLLEQKSPVKDELIEVLAKAGSHISVKLSDIYPFLKRICLEGTRTQAKFAVSAIASLSSDQSAFLNLYEGLIDSLYSQWNVPTILQSLGCIAQYSISTFETRDEEIISYICQDIIQVDLFDDGHDATSYDDSRCSDSCQLKIYGLKTVLKSFLPHQGCVRRKINGLLDILLKMLQESDNFVGIDSCKTDKAHIRLAAAKSILRLSRRWDLQITPELFRSTILVAKDLCSSARRSFLSKIQKMLKEHRLPIRFACAFPLAETDGVEDLQCKNKYMAEFIKDYSREARARQTSAMQGAVIDYPAYIVVFLIHVLAHDPGFPSESCQDEETYADFCSPLFLVLRALLNASIVDGDQDLVDDVVLYVFSILRAIRKAEDAVDAQMTTKLHFLADIGIFILNALNHGKISTSQAPGQILLPSSLYRMSLSGIDAKSKCRKSSFDECFLSRIFHKLKSNVPQASVQKPVKTLPRRGRKSQEDAPQTNILSGKQDDLSGRAVTVAKAVMPNIPSGEKNKRVVSPVICGSVGLHECSTIDRQQNLASERPQDKKQLSSCDSVSFEGSLVESNISTQKLKRSSLTENPVTSGKSTVQPPKRPRTERKDPCGSKREDIRVDDPNKSHFSHCDPDKHSSLSNLKKTTATKGALTKKGRTFLNQVNVDKNGGRTSLRTSSASEIFNTSP
ncbi:hypothetical protein L6164_016184 [Bauhinia variegata]|uniref:Uncharacterized protein n=1 Tax=Bauhinia variegata TaxID=167791 RepID=A0ACB9NMW0_BAUVA|nr:hypothetical protein L6164_016184 [Bauhinia variegata]